MRFFIWASQLLVILAGLNLGFVGFFEVNPIEALISCPMFLSLFYALVGFAALVLTISKIAGYCMCGADCKCGCNCATEAKHSCCCSEQKVKKAKK